MDQNILTFFNQTLAHPLLDSLMALLTFGGLALLPGLGVMLSLGPYRRVGLAILIALAVGLAGVLLFQYLALCPRPTGVRLIYETPNFPSFPSGHAAAAFSTAVILGLTLRRTGWWLGLLTGAGLIALSRVYLGVHYPSDILAGAVLGASVGAAGYGLLLDRHPGRSVWRWLLWPQIAIAFVISLMAYLDFLPLWLLTWPYIDKILHFILFGTVAFWLNLWLAGRMLRWRTWSMPVAVFLPLTVALFDEGLQHFSPLRSMDLSDLLCDLAGLLLFWWLSRRLLARDKAEGAALRNSPESRLGGH
jgi:undecaprenyl-diphosphatase